MFVISKWLLVKHQDTMRDLVSKSASGTLRYRNWFFCKCFFSRWIPLRSKLIILAWIKVATTLKFSKSRTFWQDPASCSLGIRDGAIPFSSCWWRYPILLHFLPGSCHSPHKPNVNTHSQKFVLGMHLLLWSILDSWRSYLPSWLHQTTSRQRPNQLSTVSPDLELQIQISKF